MVKSAIPDRRSGQKKKHAAQTPPRISMQTFPSLKVQRILEAGCC
jgi:hypothetical protein